MRRLLSHNPLTGTKKYVLDNPDDPGGIVVETHSDLAPLIDSNKEQYNQAPATWGEGRKVASIPLEIYFQLKQQGIADDPIQFRKWLNDPDNRYFRTMPGKV